MKAYSVNKSDLKHSWSAIYLVRREKVKDYFSKLNISGLDTANERTTEIKSRITEVDKLNPVDVAILQKLIQSHNKLKRLYEAMR